MADGTQSGFDFRELPVSRLRPGEIVVDLFAGGGGASTGLEQALGRPVDIAINHNPIALAMHAANHPFTRHLAEDVWEADPRKLVAGRAVGWMHASPDCTHFSQAKGGQPRSRATRSLSWVVLRWAGQVRPRIISMENVWQILQWGPLVAKRDKVTGRALRIDGTVAAPGDRLPIEQQFLIPDKRHAGRTWRAFVSALRAMGYVVEWRKLKACDYGAGTSRERLFLIARCDGAPIQWPEPTHGPGRAEPYVTAADCIDWSIPCPSIFERKRPLADATLRRIARGIKRYVIDAAEPFIVPATHHGSDRCNPMSQPFPTITAANRGELMAVSPVVVQCANASADGIAPAARPLGTVTSQPKGGSHAVAAATLVQTGYGERPGQAPRVPGIDKPLGTLVDGQKHAVVTAYLDQANGGGPNGNPAPPRGADEPVSSITGTGSQQRLVAVHLQHASTSNTNGGRGRVDLPLRTVMAGGQHHAVVECVLSPEQEAGALRVAALMVNYYGNGQPLDLTDPMDTITTRDRIALVTVTIKGTPYVIVDIGLRMLKPHELYRAQGFPADYVIDRTACGKPLTISQAVAMVGNSVSPPPMRAIAAANLDPIPLQVAA
jgi:DNA (cytosine-5)-methyltransferase 1